MNLQRWAFIFHYFTGNKGLVYSVSIKQFHQSRWCLLRNKSPHSPAVCFRGLVCVCVCFKITHHLFYKRFICCYTTTGSESGDDRCTWSCSKVTRADAVSGSVCKETLQREGGRVNKWEVDWNLWKTVVSALTSYIMWLIASQKCTKESCSGLIMCFLVTTSTFSFECRCWPLLKTTLWDLSKFSS